MSDIKVTQLSRASTHNVDDLLMVIQNGVNKAATLTTILKNLNSDDVIQLNPIQNAVSTRISTKSAFDMLFIDGVNDKIGIKTSQPQETLHINGNVKVGSSGADGVILRSTEILNAGTSSVSNVVISSLREITSIKAYGSCSYILGNGFEGQTKRIYFEQSIIGGSTVDISIANGLGFNHIAMDTVGDAITLIYQNSKWVAFGNNGCTISTI